MSARRAAATVISWRPSAAALLAAVPELQNEKRWLDHLRSRAAHVLFRVAELVTAERRSLRPLPPGVVHSALPAGSAEEGAEARRLLHEFLRGRRVADLPLKADRTSAIALALNQFRHPTAATAVETTYAEEAVVGTGAVEAACMVRARRRWCHACAGIVLLLLLMPAPDASYYQHAASAFRLIETRLASPSPLAHAFPPPFFSWFRRRYLQCSAATSPCIRRRFRTRSR